MTDLLLTSLNYGGYISVVKFAILVVLFFATLPLLGWVHRDAAKVGTNQAFWTAVVCAAFAAATLLWLIVPFVIVALLIFLIAVGAAVFAYITHRNNLVSDFEKVLTPEHIKGLFENESKKLDDLRNLMFITANNNEVPLPQTKSEEFFSFKAAYDIFADAIRRRASDVVFTPAQVDYKVTYYIDGAAIKQPDMPKEKMDYFNYFVKSLAALDTKEKRKPQKGKFTIHKEGSNIEWQVATAGSTAGEQIHLKQLTHENIGRLTDLGLTAQQLEQLSKLRDLDQGLFLITGPAKNGVTTTFYSMLRNHDPYLNTIATLEKQTKGTLVNITQNTFVLSDTGTTTYAKKLQSIIQTEPSIIGVSDCQDSETAKVACRTASEDQLVYATIQADNVIQALGKWIKIVGDKNLAVGCLLGITNQRLLRVLCQGCKQAYEPNRALLKKFNIPPEKAKTLYRAGKVQYNKKAKASTCEKCQGTGYVGRMAVFEMINLNTNLRQFIIQAKSLSEVTTEFRRNKMLYLQEQALIKVIEGKTAINEIVRALSLKSQAAQQKSKNQS